MELPREGSVTHEANPSSLFSNSFTMFPFFLLFFKHVKLTLNLLDKKCSLLLSFDCKPTACLVCVHVPFPTISNLPICQPYPHRLHTNPIPTPTLLTLSNLPPCQPFPHRLLVNLITTALCQPYQPRPFATLYRPPLANLITTSPLQTLSPPPLANPIITAPC